jgi:NDP-sugar pyrophosphorylase family protein
MTRAMILAAGLGTRLAPLTDERPKPLAPVGDRPLLAHLTDRLARGGFLSFAMNIHHLSKEFAIYINSLPIKAHVVDEVEIRGTAGGIAGARTLLGPAPVLVWNGDVLVDPPVEALLAGADSGGLAFAVAPRAIGEGTVGLDALGHVVRLRGETFGVETAGGDYVGVAAVGARVLAGLPERGCLIGDVALPELRAGGTVATVHVAGPWADIGSLHEYQRANLDWLARRGSESWVGPGATVTASVVLSSSLVGAGASVGGHGLLERCIVWPGAHAVAPLIDAVVTPAGRVVAIS